jgi:urease accessory protein
VTSTNGCELLLLLADGRFPGGGYAHSGGLEAAVAEGGVATIADLEDFLRGRLSTVGLVEAWLAAAACRGDDPLVLQAECDARTPSPALRAAGRSLGRGLRRSAAVTWPAVAACPAEQHPVVLGAVARAAGLDPEAAARLSVHGNLLGPATAAPKLAPLDMAEVVGLVARLAPLADATVAHALDEPDCPTPTAPLLEARAERHAHWEVRLFAS